MPSTDVFPALYCCSKLFKNEHLYDVEFYPYPTTEDDQIFAVAGERDVFICRPKLDNDPPFELLRWFKDQDPNTSINSFVWTKDHLTRRPLLCIAGSVPKQIRILEIEKGDCIRTIPGHGKAINDLAISPLSTDLIASCSADYTIRLWNLHPKYEKQPCVAMFCGEGHKQPILAIHFHPNGRWLLSGGLDTAVCLWSVPSLDELSNHTEAELENGVEPKIIYYPYFYSTEVHHNYVDSLQFYGSLMISRACKDQNSRNKANEILLWKIEGFDPEAAPPDIPPMPAPDVNTRSSFPHSTRSRGFQRLLTFHMPNTDRFYQRFSLLHQPGMRPILCMGNQESKFFFWDLQKLEEGWDPAEEKKPKKRPGRKPKAGVSSENLNRLDDLRKTESLPSSSDGGGGTGGGTPLASAAGETSTSAPPDHRKSSLSDPFEPLKAHYTVTPQTRLSSKQYFGTQQMAWSPDGTWLVGVGDRGVMTIFHRDASLVNGAPKAGA